MTPAQLSAQLRRIAAAIDASERPDPRKVASAIRGVMSRVSSDEASLEGLVKDLWALEHWHNPHIEWDKVLKNAPPGTGNYLELCGKIAKNGKSLVKLLKEKMKDEPKGE
jgi:hypothetical protein